MTSRSRNAIAEWSDWDKRHGCFGDRDHLAAYDLTFELGVSFVPAGAIVAIRAEQTNQDVDAGETGR